MTSSNNEKMSYDEKHFEKGITRKHVGEKFVYYYINNGVEVTLKDMDRIAKLKIPPAWTNLWVSRDPNSTIQAIGQDAKGRKQYRYHQVHIKTAEREKFLRLYNFIKEMPKLDKALMQHDDLYIYDKNRVISLMLQMVKEYHMRVGKEIYARENKSYGISSLRKKHVTIEGNTIYLRFKGKSNQRLHYTITNEKFIKDIKMLMKLDGEKLFQYIMIDNLGRERIHNVNDKDLNQYIQHYMGSEFSIKDFRTYASNEIFLRALLNETKKRKPKNKKAIKKNIINSFKSTARQLKHTGAVAKKSYVMNFATELYCNKPEFFVKNKNENPTEFLLKLLKLYKEYILKDE